MVVAEMKARLHDVALVAFVALLGLFEGPAEAACVFVLVARAASERLRTWPPERPSPIAAGVIIWVLAGVPGVVAAKLHGVALSSEDTLRPLLALAFLVGRNSIAPSEPALLRRLAIVFIAAVALNALYGYLQALFGELPLDRLLLKNPRSQQLYLPEKVYEVRCASGLYYNRLKLAHVGIVALGLAMLVVSGANLERRSRALYACLGIVIAGAVVLTYARMALVAFAVAAAIVVSIIARPRIVLATAASCALLLGAWLATAGAAARLATAERDANIRLHLFRTAFDVFRAHPWLGVGHGMYRKVVAPHFDGTGAMLDAHNMLLQVLSETGVIGLAGCALAIGTALYLLITRVRRDRRSSSEHALLDRFALFGLLAYLILGLVHVPTHHAPVAMLFWCLLGISDQSAEPRSTRGGP